MDYFLIKHEFSSYDSIHKAYIDIFFVIGYLISGITFNYRIMSKITR